MTRSDIAHALELEMAIHGRLNLFRCGVGGGAVALRVYEEAELQSMARVEALTAMQTEAHVAYMDSLRNGYRFGDMVETTEGAVYHPKLPGDEA